ncbi:hypothetical protein [Streptomyces sp. NPDC057689]|uniref:hypothetical protein n=1 Tax=Streptomyces sp. NPDC057689 TaxID=3346213 RepID=UPI0036936DB3
MGAALTPWALVVSGEYVAAIVAGSLPAMAESGAPVARPAETTRGGARPDRAPPLAYARGLYGVRYGQ